jgi:hypothetical protein
MKEWKKETGNKGTKESQGEDGGKEEKNESNNAEKNRKIERKVCADFQSEKEKYIGNIKVSC